MYGDPTERSPHIIHCSNCGSEGLVPGDLTLQEWEDIRDVDVNEGTLVEVYYWLCDACEHYDPAVPS